MGESKEVDYNHFKQEIVQAYDASETAYKLTWNLSKSKSIHYGYKDETTKSFSDTLNRMNEVVCSRAQICASDKILDAGCGIGGSAIYLAKSVGCQVTGINLSENQLKEARKYASLNQVDGLVNFTKADYLSMPFPDESFDVVWAIESVFHTPDKCTFFEEAFRVLKPNGRIVLADYLLNREVPSKVEQNLLEKWYDGYAIPSLQLWDDFEAQIKASGFINSHHRDISQFIMPSSKRLYRLGAFAKYTWPFSAAFMKQKGMKESQPNSLIAQYKALKKELWKYALIYAEKV